MCLELDGAIAPTLGDFCISSTQSGGEATGSGTCWWVPVTSTYHNRIILQDRAHA